MTIDSHAHYNNNAYKKPFRYLTRNAEGYALAEGNREQLFRELLDANIPYSIEPGVSIQSSGEVLQLEERAKDLWEAVPHIPLDRILIDTDAPFSLPYCKDVIQPKLLRWARNTSLILPAVIQKIAELKNIPAEEVEQATAVNAIRLFGLSVIPKK